MSTLIQLIKSIFSTSAINTNRYKMVLIVRTDIQMGKGKTAAQCAHAALECYRQAMSDKTNHQVFESWLRIGQPKIVLKISSEQALLDLAKKTRKAGIITAVIRDAGRTQLTPGTISAIGLGPAHTEIVDRFTSNLKLL